MKLERAGKNIVMAEVFGVDVLHCDILTPLAIERIVQNNNFGEEVMALYKEVRENATLHEVTVFMNYIEKLYHEYQFHVRSVS